MDIDMSNFETTEVKLPGGTLKTIDLQDLENAPYILRENAKQQIRNLELGIKMRPIIKGDDVGEMMRIRFAGAIDWIKYFFDLNDANCEDKDE